MGPARNATAAGRGGDGILPAGSYWTDVTEVKTARARPTAVSASPQCRPNDRSNPAEKVLCPLLIVVGAGDPPH